MLLVGGVKGRGRQHRSSDRAFFVSGNFPLVEKLLYLSFDFICNVQLLLVIAIYHLDVKMGGVDTVNMQHPQNNHRISRQKRK